MGNPDHMRIILDGDVDTWNLWRRNNLRVQPDLTRIDLSGRDLSKIDFRGVGLFKANLSGCNLSEAVLRQSIAIKTDFTNANYSNFESDRPTITLCKETGAGYLETVYRVWVP